MTPARWTSILLAACAGVLGPMLAMTTVSSCGSNSSSDNGSGSDATTDGPNTGDGSHQGDGRGGIGDAGSGDHDLGNWDACSGSCPPTVLCGHYTNPCTGAVLACGTYCNAGQVCVNQGGSPPSASCQPLATQCADKCGFYGNDNCGVPIYCGGCEGGLACIHNSCLPQQVSDAAPRTRRAARAGRSRAPPTRASRCAAPSRTAAATRSRAPRARTVSSAARTASAARSRPSARRRMPTHRSAARTSTRAGPVRWRARDARATPSARTAPARRALLPPAGARRADRSATAADRR